MLYLDNASTTKPINLEKIVKEYMDGELWGNPSSLHKLGNKAKARVERVRALVAKEINAEPCEIYFTSGASECNSWVLDFNWNTPYGNVIVAETEHKSIINNVKKKDFRAMDKDLCHVLEDGSVDNDDLYYLLLKAKKNKSLSLVCVGFANNEIGTINNIKEIAEIVHKQKGLLYTDATQAFGHIPIDVKDLDVDMMCASGHKINALKGIGFLYKKKGVEIEPMIYGTQENGLRGGTENVLGIMSLGEAVKNIDYKKADYVREIRDYAINELSQKFGCKLNGSRENRLPNNINVTFPQNITGEALIYMLETSDIYISAGSACNSRSNEPSHVLKAIGLSDRAAMKTIRITLPDDITREQVDYFIKELDKAIKILDHKVVDDGSILYKL